MRLGLNSGRLSVLILTKTAMGAHGVGARKKKDEAMNWEMAHPVTRG